MNSLSRLLSDIPPAYGYVDHMREVDGTFRVTGWMMLLDGPFDEIRIRCEDPVIDHCAQQFEVPALGEAEAKPGAARAAFFAEVPIPHPPRGRTLELVAVGMRGGNPAGFMTLGYHRPPVEQDYPPP